MDIDHIAIAVENLESSIRWYTEGLGFAFIEQRTTTGERTGMRSAVLVNGTATVVLIQGTSPESQVSRFIQHFGPGVQHVAFAVADLDATVRKIRQCGGNADTSLIEGKGIRQVFLRRDPGSGVRVELIERRGGSFSDETVSELFRQFEARDLY